MWIKEQQLGLRGEGVYPFAPCYVVCEKWGLKFEVIEGGFYICLYDDIMGKVQERWFGIFCSKSRCQVDVETDAQANEKHPRISAAASPVREGFWSDYKTFIGLAILIY